MNWIMRNKAGTEYLSIWWFICLALIVGSVLISVNVFFSSERDIREYEAEFLYNKLVYCISENGYLIDGFFDEFNLESCGIDESFFGVGSKYFLQIQGESLSGENLVLYEFGQKAFEKECELSNVLEVEKAHFCFNDSLNLLFFAEETSSKKVIKLNFLIAIEDE